MKNSIKFTFIFFSILYSFAFADTKILYDKIDIPGATCGDGLQYHVFVNKTSKQDSKILFYLESGGACWSWSTCWGPNFRAWIHPLPFPRIKLRKFKDRDVFADYSTVIFPYCTGDIFGANYKAKYGVKHVGKKNIELTLKYLSDQGILNYNQYQTIAVGGSSAGAIGALINANHVESHFKNATEKNLILDSPGLHWGEKFWNKFNVKMVDQFKQSTAHIIDDLTDHGGDVIKHLPQICSHFFDWNVGILQSTKDVIMSTLFGNISPKNHREKVYGPNGLYQQSLGISNCSAWSPDSYGHAYLQLDPLQVVEAGTTDSIEFVEMVLNGDTTTSFRD